MPLPNPKLDDRRFADLVAEARALLPTYDPDWTNHNASDPGITLLELFAWLAESLIYRADQITDSHRSVFLKLIHGPDWKLPPPTELSAAIADTMTELRRPSRCVTLEDYKVFVHEYLQKEKCYTESDLRDTRLKCIPNRNLEAFTAQGRQAEAAGHISLVVALPEKCVGETKWAEVRQGILEHLEPGRLLTVRHHVVPPTSVPVSATIVVASRLDVTQDTASADEAPAHAPVAVSTTDLRQGIQKRLKAYLTDGPDGHGWPIGRPIFLSELYRELQSVEGVAYIISFDLNEAPEKGKAPTAHPQFNDDGHQISLALAEDQVPDVPDINKICVYSSPSFVEVKVNISIGKPAFASRGEIERGIRELFLPLTPDSFKWERYPRSVTVEDIRGKIANIIEEDIKIQDIQVSVNGEGPVNGRILIPAGSLADVTVMFEEAGHG